MLEAPWFPASGLSLLNVRERYINTKIMTLKAIGPASSLLSMAISSYVF